MTTMNESVQTIFITRRPVGVREAPAVRIELSAKSWRACRAPRRSALQAGPSLPGDHQLVEGFREPADVAHARLVKLGQDARHYQVSSMTSAGHRTPDCGHARMHQPSVVGEALVT
jgi:hypothetical protein